VGERFRKNGGTRSPMRAELIRIKRFVIKNASTDSNQRPLTIEAAWRTDQYLISNTPWATASRCTHHLDPHKERRVPGGHRLRQRGGDLEEWQLDALGQCRHDERPLEGDDTTAAAIVPTSRVGNRTQILKKPSPISPPRRS